MAGKKPLGSLQPIAATAAKPKVDAVPATRGTVQTVRMDRDTFKALRDACFDRGISQQELMLAAIRRDIGLE